MGNLNPTGTEWTRPIRVRVAISGTGDFAAGECRAIYVGGTGDVTLKDIENNTCEMVALAAGVWHPMAAVGITAISGATDIVIGY